MKYGLSKKRRFAFAVFGLAICMALCSCSTQESGETTAKDTPESTSAGSARVASKDDFIGTWELSSWSVDGETYDGDDLVASDLAMKVVISDDGLAYVVTNGEAGADAYSISGNTLTVTDANDGTATPFVLEGDKLVLDYSNIEWPSESEFEGLDAVATLEKTSDDGALESANCVGNWKGYDARFNAMDVDEAMILSDVDMSASLSIDDDLTGRFVLTRQTDSDSIFLNFKLTPTDKTASYLVSNIDTSGNVGMVDYFNDSGQEWLFMTLFTSETEYIQFSFIK